MSQGSLLPVAIQYATDANGLRVAGAKLYVYAAGTLNAVAIYADSGLSVLLANPLTADGSGCFVEIFLPPGITVKVNITQPDGVTSLPKYPADNVPSTPITAGNEDVQWTAGEPIAAGAACYLSAGDGGKTAGLAYNADAANPYSSTVNEVGIAIAAIANGSQGTVRKGGQLTGQVGLTVGAAYYVGTAGAITTVAPSNSRRIGQAVSATVLDISANPPTGAGGYDFVQLQCFG